MKTLIPQKSTLRACIATSLLLLTLAACDDNDSSDVGYVKLYNLSYDSPTMYLTLDEDLSSDSDDDDEHYEATYTGLDYGSAHSNIEVENQDYEYQIAWQSDDDSTDTDDLEVVYEDEIDILEDTIHLIVFHNSILSPEVSVYAIPEIDEDEVDDDSDDDLFNLRVLNMHPNGDAIDLYMSEDDESFSEAELFSSANFLELSDNQKVDQDDYIFYITTAGSNEVLFTSESIPFSYASQNIMIVKDNNGPGSSLYTLDKMSDSSVTEYVDEQSDAQFSAYNAVEKNDLLDENYNQNEEMALHLGDIGNTPIIDALAYGEMSELLLMASADYSLNLTTTVDDGLTPLLSRILLSLAENTNQTLFIYTEEVRVEDEYGENIIIIIDEDGTVVYEMEMNMYTLAVENSLATSIYQHEVEIVNLIQSDDFSSVNVYFVKSDETVDTALYSRSVNYKKNSAITLPNNSFDVYVIATDNDSRTILSQFKLTLDEDSIEQFLILEVEIDGCDEDDVDCFVYKATLLPQTPSSDDE
ncbi:MAG: hypothetical protein V5789_14620 [Colwellia sp.]